MQENLENESFCYKYSCTKGFLQYITGNFITAKALMPAAGAANGEQFKDDDDNGTSKKCQFVIHGI